MTREPLIVTDAKVVSTMMVCEPRRYIAGSGPIVSSTPALWTVRAFNKNAVVQARPRLRKALLHLRSYSLNLEPIEPLRKLLKKVLLPKVVDQPPSAAFTPSSRSFRSGTSKVNPPLPGPGTSARIALACWVYQPYGKDGSNRVDPTTDSGR